MFWPTTTCQGSSHALARARFAKLCVRRIIPNELVMGSVADEQENTYPYHEEFPAGPRMLATSPPWFCTIICYLASAVRFLAAYMCIFARANGNPVSSDVICKKMVRLCHDSTPHSQDLDVHCLKSLDAYRNATFIAPKTYPVGGAAEARA
jgi:hypothetical protein